MFVIPPIGQAMRRAALQTQVISTVLVFAVLATFTIISWQNALATLEDQKTRTVNEKTAAIENDIYERIDANGMLLKAGSGLFNGSTEVTRDDWQHFFDKFNVEQDFDGVSAVGYAAVVPRDNLSDFEARMQQDTDGNFALKPAGDRPVYAPSVYAARFNDTMGTLGFDMYSDPVRRTAMERARDSGQTVMTDVVNFKASNNSGVLLYLPVYRKDTPITTVSERQQALQGFVFVSLRANKLFSEVLPKDETNIGFTVSEISNGKTHSVYSSIPSNTKEAMRKVRASTLTIYGREWQIGLFTKNSIVSNTDNQRPFTILAGGLVISLIASVAVYFLIQYRTRTFALAEEHRLQQAKDELLSLASHQLRTPATGVKQYVGMVMDGFGGKVPKEQIRLLEQAYKSNERQLQIINEFLYVAKIGSGSLTTTEHEFDLVPVVRDVVAEMDGDIKEKQHKIIVKSPKTAIIRADEHSVRMIIENLLSNAVKYTYPKGKIEVRLQRTLQEIKVSIKDTGIGIAKKDTELLFKQFSRIPNKLSVEVNGSGIGLYLSQQLALRNNGAITMVSEPNAGSTFTLHLYTKSVRKFTKRSPQP